MHRKIPATWLKWFGSVNFDHVSQFSETRPFSRKWPLRNYHLGAQPSKLVQFFRLQKKRRPLTGCPGPSVKLPKLGKEIAKGPLGQFLSSLTEKGFLLFSQKWPNLRWNRLGYLPSRVKPHKKPCLKTSEGIFNFHTWDKLHGICHHLAICICLKGSTQKIDRRVGWGWEDGVE